MSTPHIQASKGEIAPIVLMPGDPLRAQFIANTYLDNVVQFNAVRNMFGYTGTYQGVPVSVMGSGMGMPSIGIYSYELYNTYDVEVIIRIGSAGAYTTETKLFDVVLARTAYSESSFASAAFGYPENELSGSDLVNQALKFSAQAQGKTIIEGCIHSSDVFYHGTTALKNKVEEKHCLAVEMESFALFANARYLNKQAACLVTISDSLVTHEVTTAEERQTAFTNMMEIALGAVKSLSE